MGYDGDSEAGLKERSDYGRTDIARRVCAGGEQE